MLRLQSKQIQAIYKISVCCQELFVKRRRMSRCSDAYMVDSLQNCFCCEKQRVETVCIGVCFPHPICHIFLLTNSRYISSEGAYITAAVFHGWFVPQQENTGRPWPLALHSFRVIILRIQFHSCQKILKGKDSVVLPPYQSVLFWV